MSGVHGWGDESDSSSEEEEPVVKISAAALAVQASSDVDEAPRRGRYTESRKKSPFRNQQDTRGSRQTSLQDARRGPPPDRFRGRGGGGRGRGPSNWKAAAKSESILGTSSSATVDGSSWMAQRRAKQQAHAEELAHQRAAQDEQERVAKKERRASQFEALRQAVQAIEHEQHTMPSTAEPSVGGSSLQQALAASTVQHVGERPVTQKQPSWRDRAAMEFDDHSVGSHRSPGVGGRGSPGRGRGEGGWVREDASWREPLAQERPIIKKRPTPQRQPSWRESAQAEENDDNSRVSLSSLSSHRTMGSHHGRGGGGRGGRGRGRSRGRGEREDVSPRDRTDHLERDSEGRGHGRARSGRGRGAPVGPGSGHGRSVVVLDTHAVETASGTVEYRVDLEHSSSKKKDNKAELQPNGTVVVSRGKKKLDKKQKAAADESHSKEPAKDDEHKRINGGLASPSRGSSHTHQHDHQQEGGGRGRGRGGRGRGRSRGGKGRGRRGDEGRADGDRGSKPRPHASRIEIGKDE